MALPKKKTKREGLWDLKKEVDKLFRDFVEGPVRGEDIIYLPPLDIYEEEDKIVIEAEIPGVNKSDIKINVADNVLTIKAEKRKKEKVKDKNIMYEEIVYGRYERDIELPPIVDTDKIEAVYDRGVLKVEIPKKEEVKPREVKIK